jgi:hypothetical protein
MKKVNSKEYPTIKYLQNKILVPVSITEATDEEGNNSYDYMQMEYEDTAANRRTISSTQAELDYLNLLKKERLEAGFEVDGVLFDSDTTAELRYVQLSTKFQSDPTYSVDWKASEGTWVTMNATLFASVLAAFEAHIAATYAWLKVEQDKINEA